MALGQVIIERRSQIVDSWTDRVQKTIAPQVSPPELIDHLPIFLDALVAALGDDKRAIQSDLPRAAAIHGEHRLRLGFSLESLVYEYGMLHRAIIDTANGAGIQATGRELDVLFDAILSGIAFAVSEYIRRRDAEFMRQANERFAFIAHELRNPLSSALAALQILKTSGQVPVEGHAVGALERGLHQTLCLIDESLNVARIASGIEVRPERTTLRGRLEAAKAGVTAEVDAKNIDLRLVADDAAVLLDVRLVQSALDNLTRNAVKHTPPGGTVQIRARLVEDRAIFEVEDRCGGLEPGLVEQAFAPFVQLDAGKGGFGLGLAIAKEAVGAHGGTIRVQNLPGTGCIFVLDIPVMPSGVPSS